MASIPIENLYYLFCYAWDRFPEGRSTVVGATESPSVWDLFASVLIRGTLRLIRRGLDRSYAEIEEDASSIRGRIVVAETTRRGLLLRGQAHCRFDELRHDVLHNQILKATLRKLCRSDELQRDLKLQLASLVRSMPEISDIRVSISAFRKIQLSRNSGHYDLLLRVCQLVHSALLPTEDGQSNKFSDILDDEVRMPAVFETFVRNFFKAEQTRFSVGAENLSWKVAGDVASLAYLPIMKTDVTLRSVNRNIIVDAKFYKQAIKKHFGKDRLYSSHLYQLFAYLKHFEGGAEAPPVEGVLLYPATGDPLDVTYELSGHRVRVVTLQLDQSWQVIHAAMIALLDEALVPSPNSSMDGMRPVKAAVPADCIWAAADGG